MTVHEPAEAERRPTGRSGPDETTGAGDRELFAALDRLEATTNAWLEAHAEKFDLLAWDGDVTEHKFLRKAFSEAALYLLLLDNLGSDPRERAPKLHETVVRATNSRLYHHAMLRNPTLVRGYAYPVIYVHEVGELEDPQVWADLQDVLQREYVWAEDRLPYATMDLWHLATLAGTEPLHDAETILELSCLANPLEPFRASMDDIYHLTHNVMFYRGLGMSGYSFPTEPAPHDVGLTLQTLVLRFWADGMYDAALELLFSGVLQRQIPPDLVAETLVPIADAAEEHGFVPDLTVDDDTVDSVSSNASEVFDDPETVHWGENYHVNLVAGYAAQCIRNEWDALRAAYDGVERPGYEHDRLAQLGEAVLALSKYDLKRGATSLADLVGDPVVEAFPEVFAAATAYLRDQRRDDGEFGYWAEEEMKFAALDYDPDLFDGKLLAPTTEACRTALERIDGATPEHADAA